MKVNGTANHHRSTFVTAVAWVFIALSGFSTVISILQNILVRTVFNAPEVKQAMQAPPADAPPFAVFMLNHLEQFFLAFLLVSVATLVSSIGLLRRRNWARRVFIGLMLLAMAWQLGGLVLQFAMFSSTQAQFANAPGAPDMRAFFAAMAVVGVLFALGFSVLFGWIARRLMSAQVAAEFGH